MKKILFLLSVIYSISVYAGCDNMTNYQLVIVGNNQGTWSLKDKVNEISTSQDCGKTWDDDFESVTCQALTQNYVSPVTVNSFFTSGEVDLYGLSAVLVGSGESGPYTDVLINVTLDKPFTMVSGLFRKFRLRIFHAGNVSIQMNALCSGMSYEFDDFVNQPGNHINRSLTFDSGVMFSGNGTVVLPQTVNSEENVTYTATINGLQIKRIFNKSIHPVSDISWISSINPIGVTAPDQNINSMVNYSIGLPEFNGPGIYVQSGNWMFSPSNAGTGNFIILVRGNNQGCESDWIDTTFVVQPVISVVSPPVLDIVSTFGENAFPLKTMTEPVVYPDGGYVAPQEATIGTYHQACSNQNYTFSVLNPNGALIYEWAKFWQNGIEMIGTGTTKTVTTPSYTELGTNVFQGVEPFPWNYGVSDYFNGLGGVPRFIKNGDHKTVFIGEIFDVMVRAKNVNGDVSPWKKISLGIVQRPIINVNAAQCYVDDPTLVGISLSPMYTDSIAFDVIRKTQWNIDSDPVWELVGDSVFYPILNNNKLNVFGSQIIDSNAFFMYNTLTGINEPVFINTADEMCYSTVQNVNVVRSPLPSVTWNSSGTMSVGSLIQGDVTGVYFDPALDSIIWNFTDDSNLFYGDTAYHYLNDLGTVGYTITVIDQYGCSAQLDSTAFWFVPGTLGMKEFHNDEIRIFPNPATDKIYIDKIYNDYYEVFNNLGEKITEGHAIEGIGIDVNEWPNHSTIVFPELKRYYHLVILKQ